MLRIIMKNSILLLAGALASPALFAALTIYAGTCGTPNQPTIHATINASPAGGTVLVCPGTYTEQITIAKNLTLTGVLSANSAEVVIASPANVVTNSFDTCNNAPIATQVFVQNAATFR
jgi:hypothetical protein